MDSEGIRTMVRHKLDSGELPHDHIPRFWGGPWLLYHPSSIAGVGVLIALRIGPDKAFAAGQRVAATALAAFLVTVTNHEQV